MLCANLMPMPMRLSAPKKTVMKIIRVSFTKINLLCEVCKTLL